MLDAKQTRPSPIIERVWLRETRSLHVRSFKNSRTDIVPCVRIIGANLGELRPVETIEFAVGIIIASEASSTSKISASRSV